MRRFGTLKGEVWIGKDFDGPLPDDLLVAFEGKRKHQLDQELTG